MEISIRYSSRINQMTYTIIMLSSLVVIYEMFYQ
jgi:hypothetical protein